MSPGKLLRAAAPCAVAAVCACATAGVPDEGLRETDVARLAMAGSSGEAARPLSKEGAAVLGAWKGAIVVAEQPVYVTLYLEEQGGQITGTIDIPEIDAEDEPIANVTVDGERLRFELPGDPVPGVFEADVRGERLRGTFTYLDVNGSVWAKRIAGTSLADRAAYREVDVRVPSGDVVLAGTLTVPKTRGPHPAVVLISGSGPEERDREMAGFPVFQVLAHHLTESGFAVLRLDDRGAGESTGDLAESTRQDLAKDALASVSYLKQRSDIDDARVGLLGYSEGSIVAPLAATRSDDVAFVVLLGGTALSGEEILLEQSEALLKESGLPPEAIAEQLAFQQELFENIRQNKGWDELEERLYLLIRSEYEQLPPEEQAAMGDLDLWARAAAAEQISMVKSPWFRSFLTYDPRPVLSRLDVPVLAVFGELDEQIAVEDNANAMRDAFRRSNNPDATVAVVPGANHLMQEAETGSVDEYPALDAAFTPAFTDMLIGWMQEQAKEAPQGVSRR